MRISVISILSQKMDRAIDGINALQRFIFESSQNPAECIVVVSAGAALDHSLLKTLAESIPPHAGKFSLNFFRTSVTAGEFLLQSSTLKETDYVNAEIALTEYLSASEAFSFLARLFESPKTGNFDSLAISIGNISWKGSSADANGFLFAKDIVRAAKTGQLQCEARIELKIDPLNDRRDSELAKVSKESGIDFSSGRQTVHHEPFSPAHAHEALVLSDCFQECLEKAALEIAKCGVDWRVPGVMTHSSAFDRRMEQYISKTAKQKINFNRVVSKFCQKSLSDYDSQTYRGDIRLVKNLTEEIEYFFAFEKQHFVSLGKAFSLLFGIRVIKGPLAGFELKENLFRIFHVHLETPSWIYSSVKELDEDLMSVASLFALVAPSLEDISREILQPRPVTHPEWMTKRGPMTAKRAYREALGIASDWASDTELQGVTSGVDLQDEIGPGISLDGRIKENGSWIVQFYSRRKKAYLRVEFPFHGTARKGSCGYEMAEHDVIEGEWMDSDEAFMAAETRHGGESFRRNASNIWHIGCNLSRRNADNWEVSYCMTDLDHERQDFCVRFHPVTGERFPDWY